MSGSKELRLGLVCHGGVSLAVYMHGVTRELHELVIASRAYDLDQQENPFREGSIHHLYWRLLRTVEDDCGLTLSVVIDVIAGSSAGGINAVFLARALSENRSQQLLRDLWFERADLKQLAGGGLRIAGKLLRTVGAVLLPGVTSRPPLEGGALTERLFAALAGMERESPTLPPEVGALASLVPAGQELDLFVATTDQPGFRREIPIDRPPLVAERRHRHVLHFRHRSGELGDRFVAAHTFAARATSSLPGAFPQVNPRRLIDRLQRRFGVEAVDFLEPDFRREHDLFRQYTVEDADPAATLFIDGGVLDNHPFEHALDAIAQRRADRQVDRRLLYIQPDPRSNLAAAVENPSAGAEPSGLFRTAADGLSSIPRYEPIADDLLRVGAHNRRVARLREIVAQNENDVNEVVAGALRRVQVDPAADWLDQLTGERISNLRTEIETELGRQRNLGYRPYLQARAHAVVDQFATDVNHRLGHTPGSTAALGVGYIVRGWADSQQWVGARATSESQRRFVERFDISHLRRRLLFVLQAVNDLYVEPREQRPSRHQLDAAKRRLHRLLDTVESLIAGGDLPAVVSAGLNQVFARREIIDGIRAADAEPLAAVAERLIELRRNELRQLAELLGAHLATRRAAVRQELFGAFVELTVEWPAAVRQRVLARYLGFPYWDLLIYPAVACSDIDRLDTIEVVRLSPQEEDGLEPPGWDRRPDTLVPAKLKGLGAAHFRAFFKREYRENDYLWGRLDGIAQLIDLVLSSGAGTSAHSAEAQTMRARLSDELKRAGWRAVLATEGGAVKTRAARRLVRDLRRQLL